MTENDYYSDSSEFIDESFYGSDGYASNREY